MKTIYLAGGCFWGVERYMSRMPGVTGTEVGYANGSTENPTYEEVRYQPTGHAETCKVTYDETKLSLTEMLTKFFEVVDPLSVNKQGEDEGISYRSGVFYTEEKDLPEIQAFFRKLEEKLGKKTAVQVEPLKNYYKAEEYHQKYLEKNPGGYCHISCIF